VENFKSFLNPDVIHLKSGVNVLVGKNNSGKSALLQSLKLIGNIYCFGNNRPRFGDMNILNLRNLSRAKERIKIVLTLELNENERRKALGRLDPERSYLIDELLPSPVLKKINFFLEDLWSEDAHGLRVRSVRTLDGNAEEISLADLDHENKTWTFHTYKLVSNGLVNAGSRRENNNDIFPPHDFPFDLLKTIVGRIYYISPHRVAPPTLPLGTEESIASDASNLHQAVHTLANNYPEKFKEVEKIFCRTFNDINSIKTPNLPDNKTSIHLVEKSTGIEIPLSESGTGLEQFLSLLMIVMTSNERRIILIDEPHVFLHPESEKAFIEILHANPQHQYIIATHSPSWMNVVDLSSIHWVKKEKGQSTIRLISTADTERLQTILKDLGLKNSDIGMADKVIFVEGPSDAKIIPLFLNKLGFKHKLTGVLFTPLRETDSFLSKKAEVFIKAYCRLLEQLSTIKIPYMFVLDSHGKTQDHIEELKKRFKDRIYFLPRYEIENYLLEPNAILLAIKEEIDTYCSEDLKSNILSELHLSEIQELISQNKEKAEMYPLHREPTHEWKKDITGSKVLQNIYEAFNLQYSKLKSGPRIAKYIDKNTFKDELNSIFDSFL